MCRGELFISLVLALAGCGIGHSATLELHAVQGSEAAGGSQSRCAVDALCTCRLFPSVAPRSLRFATLFCVAVGPSSG